MVERGLRTRFGNSRVAKARPEAALHLHGRISGSGLLRVDLASREAGCGPIVEAASVGDLDALGGKSITDQPGAPAGTAIQDHFFVTGLREKFLPQFLRSIEIAFWQQHGIGGNSGFGPLGGLADVDEHSFVCGHQGRGVLRGYPGYLTGIEHRRETEEEQEDAAAEK